ncbi:hypothetical protein LLG95_06855 [bacterium]|nr:hypothetical protein [bacterium]
MTEKPLKKVVQLVNEDISEGEESEQDLEALVAESGSVQSTIVEHDSCMGEEDEEEGGIADAG